MMQYLEKLEAILTKTVELWGIPGLAVGIIKENEVVYAKGFGVQSLDTGVPVNEDSIFCVSSVSKAFVASALMQLMEREKINLDAPITSYLPYFEMADKRYNKITSRQILSHTSGMPDMTEHEYNEMMIHSEWDDGAAERNTRKLRDLSLVSEPGEEFHYSNIAFNVLGDLIAKVSGKPFEAHIKKALLNPAGMQDSTFLLADVPRERLVVPHLRTPEMRVNPIYPYHRADAPSSFLHASLRDMCAWCRSVLAHDGSLLSRNSFEQMWTPVHGWGGDQPDIYEDMGLGWTLGHFDGIKTVSHGGMGFGWTDFLLILPEKNCAAVILSNEESYVRDQIVKAVANTMVDVEPQLDKVSWMLPISMAFVEGGIAEAHAQFEAIKNNDEAYYADEWELLNLVIQLVSAGKIDTAIQVLEINLRRYPKHAPSYLEQARLYLQQGLKESAKENLRKVLTLEPENAEALAMGESLGSKE